MVLVNNATAAELLALPVSSKAETMRRLSHVLSRSLADEPFSDDLFDTLEEILNDCHDPRPADRGRKLDQLLVRLGLPLPRQQRRATPAPLLSKEEATTITNRFNRATTRLLQIVPHRLDWYPTEEMRRLRALHDERPAIDEPLAALSYLRRYAVAITVVLDLLGDDA